METKFCDGVGGIVIKSGVARVDFFELRPQGSGQEEGRPHPSYRLILSLEGLVQTHAALQQVVDVMLEKKVIEKKAG